MSEQRHKLWIVKTVDGKAIAMVKRGNESPVRPNDCLASAFGHDGRDAMYHLILQLADMLDPEVTP